MRECDNSKIHISNNSLCPLALNFRRTTLKFAFTQSLRFLSVGTLKFSVIFSCNWKWRGTSQTCSQLAYILYDSACVPEPVLFLLKRDWFCPCQDSNVNSPIVHFAVYVLQQIFLLPLLRQIQL